MKHFPKKILALTLFLSSLIIFGTNIASFAIGEGNSSYDALLRYDFGSEERLIPIRYSENPPIGGCLDCESVRQDIKWFEYKINSSYLSFNVFVPEFISFSDEECYKWDYFEKKYAPTDLESICGGYFMCAYDFCDEGVFVGRYDRNVAVMNGEAEDIYYMGNGLELALNGTIEIYS